MTVLGQPTAQGWEEEVEKEEDHQKVYDAVPRTEDVFKVHRQDIDLLDQLGMFTFTIDLASSGS